MRFISTKVNCRAAEIRLRFFGSGLVFKSLLVAFFIFKFSLFLAHFRAFPIRVQTFQFHGFFHRLQRLLERGASVFATRLKLFCAIHHSRNSPAGWTDRLQVWQPTAVDRPGYALSLDINRLRGRKNGVATIGITTPLNGPTADQIHRAAKNLGQLELHVHSFQQPAVLIFFRRECAEQIYIAVGTKIIAQGRAKKFQLGNAALTAKLAHGFNVVFWLHGADVFL